MSLWIDKEGRLHSDDNNYSALTILEDGTQIITNVVAGVVTEEIIKPQ